MRDYLSERNMLRAAACSGLITLLSVPRIAQGRLPLALYVPAAFVSMLLVSGAATAWEHCGGLAGLLPARRRIVAGAILAALSAAVLTPLYVRFVDPVLYRAIAATGDTARLSLAYPGTARGALAVMLWSMGFQTMFFLAAPLSLFARLARRRWVAIALTFGVRLYVLSCQIDRMGVCDGLPLFYASVGGTTLIACILFAHAGILPAALFAAGLDLHLFFPPDAGQESF